MKPDLTHLPDPIPTLLAVAFGGVTLLTLALFYRAVRHTAASRTFLAVSVLWLSALALLASQGFFLKLDTFPPRILLAPLLPTLAIGALYGTQAGRSFREGASLEMLTWLHTIRLPIELLLYALYINGQIPERMTFEGGNLDILTGLTAPLMAYLVFVKKSLSGHWLLGWNVVAVGLLLNVVIPALLSAPLPFQTMSLSQPNVAVLKMPFVWLPGYVVPVVVLSHLITFAKLAGRTNLSSIGKASVPSRQNRLG